MIVIYHLEDVGGELRFVEYDRWDKEFLGKLKGEKMTQNEVIKRFNQGYWRTADSE